MVWIPRKIQVKTEKKLGSGTEIFTLSFVFFVVKLYYGYFGLYSVGFVVKDRTPGKK